eukprot:275586-Prymnesium_polylepis.1
MVASVSRLKHALPALHTASLRLRRLRASPREPVASRRRLLRYELRRAGQVVLGGTLPVQHVLCRQRACLYHRGARVSTHRVAVPAGARPVRSRLAARGERCDSNARTFQPLPRS